MQPKILSIFKKLGINELDYPSFENFESLRIKGQPALSKVQFSLP